MDLSLFPAEEKSTRRTQTCTEAQGLAQGPQISKQLAEVRIGEVVKGEKGDRDKSFPVGRGMQWQGMPGHGGGPCTGRLHPSRLNPSQIPVALLEPQPLMDAWGVSEQS